ncbi:hypothetical protein SeMB42_g06562 [Synchytrium endobioticum]|nr:hypothetical protein SeMB42_g06562 [Synchytrium endobioticum]
MTGHAISQEHLQTLSSMLLDEKRIVTFKLLSRALGINVNAAKKLLSAYLSSNHSSSHFAVYYLSGTTDDNTILALAVNQDDLEHGKKRFKKLNSVHVYGIMPEKLEGGVDALINVDIQVARDDTPSSLAKARLTRNESVNNGGSKVLTPPKAVEKPAGESTSASARTLSRSGSSGRSTGSNTKGKATKGKQKSFFDSYKSNDKDATASKLPNKDSKSTKPAEDKSNKNKRMNDSESDAESSSKRRKRQDSDDEGEEQEHDEETKKIALLAAQNAAAATSKPQETQEDDKDDVAANRTHEYDDDDEDMPTFADDEDAGKGGLQADAMDVDHPPESEQSTEPSTRRVKKTRRVKRSKTVMDEKRKVMITKDMWEEEEYSEEEVVSAPKLKKQASSTVAAPVVVAPGSNKSKSNAGGHAGSSSPPPARAKSGGSSGGGAKKGGKKKESGAGQKSLLSFFGKG